MSDRGSFRSRGGGPSRGGRGGGGPPGRGGHHHHSKDGEQQKERPKKEAILDLNKYNDKRIVVKFNGGREVTGTLKGHDPLQNLVLDDAVETLRADPEDSDDEEGGGGRAATATRELGLLVARGTLVVAIAPVEGSEEIENPFVGGGGEGGGEG